MTAIEARTEQSGPVTQGDSYTLHGVASLAESSPFPLVDLTNAPIEVFSHETHELVNASEQALATILAADGMSKAESVATVESTKRVAMGETEEAKAFKQDITRASAYPDTVPDNFLENLGLDTQSAAKLIQSMSNALALNVSIGVAAWAIDRRLFKGDSSKLSDTKVPALRHPKGPRHAVRALLITATAQLISSCAGIMAKEAPPAVQQGLTTEVAFKAMDTFSGQSIAGGKAGIEASRGGLIGDQDGRFMVFASSTDYKRQFGMGFTRITEGSEQKTLFTFIEMKPDGTVDTFVLLQKPPNLMQKETDHREFEMAKLEKGIFNRTGKTLIVNRIGNGGTIHIFEEKPDKSIDVTLLVDPTVKDKNQKPQPTLPPPVFDNVVANQPSLLTSASLATISLLALKFDLPTPQAPEVKPTTVSPTATAPAIKPTTVAPTENPLDKLETIPRTCFDQKAQQKLIDAYVQKTNSTSIDPAVEAFLIQNGLKDEVLRRGKTKTEVVQRNNEQFASMVLVHNVLVLGHYRVDIPGGHMNCLVVALPKADGNKISAQVVSLVSDTTIDGKWSGVLFPDKDSKRKNFTNESEAMQWVDDRVGKNGMTIRVATARSTLENDSTFNDTWEGMKRSVMKSLAQNSYVVRFTKNLKEMSAITNPTDPDVFKLFDGLRKKVSSGESPNEVGIFLDFLWDTTTANP